MPVNVWRTWRRSCARLLAWVIAALVVLIASPAARAFYEPDGFRGIAWGTALSDAEREMKGLHAKHLLVGPEPACDRERRGGNVTENAVCVAAMEMDSVRV